MKKQVAFFTVLCLGLAFATPCVAQNKRAKAKKLFDKGIAALEEHDYKVALEAFEEAYDTSPHWMVLAHIGTCRSKLNMPVKAILALEKYLEEGGDDIDPEERQAARKLLEEQRKKVGVLHLIVSPKGAEAKIDGDSIGEAPFERIFLKSGPHHIIVIDGDKVYEREVNINPGQEHTLRIPEETSQAPIFPTAVPQPETEPMYEEEVAPIAQPRKPEPKPVYIQEEQQEGPEISTGEEMPNGVSIPFFIALGVTGAGTITGGVGFALFGYYKSSENNYADAISGPDWSSYSWEDTCNSGDVGPGGTIPVSNEEEAYFCKTEDDRRSYADRARHALIPAIIGTSVAVAAGATAIVFYFHPEWFSSPKNSASLALTPALGPETSGLFLTGSF
jgi:hypothetical protein